MRKLLAVYKGTPRVEAQATSLPPAQNLAEYLAKLMPTLWRKIPRSLSSLIAIFAFFSQTPAQAQNQDRTVFRVDVNLVLVDATVKTKLGQIMPDLNKDSFELREDG